MEKEREKGTALLKEHRQKNRGREIIVCNEKVMQTP